jgi:signal peptidase II
VTARRARVYDVLALLTILVVVGFDQWTKSLVVTYLSPPESHAPIPVIGQYLVIYYIQNRGAAFGNFSSNPIFLSILIAAAIVVVGYLYLRMLNSGPLIYKIVFGLILGGAIGNLVDRAHNGGSVVDFIYFRIPQIHFSFAIFNIADACISVGVVLLFLLILWSSSLRPKAETVRRQSAVKSSTTSGDVRATEHDVQS